MTKTAYLFLNGEFEKPRGWPDGPESGALVVAADGGARHALALGWPIHHLIGDLDSLAPDLADRLAEAGATLHRHPRDKNEIDFELAVDLAARQGARRLVVLAGLGGRWDMTLANLLLPLADRWPGVRFVFHQGGWRLFPLAAPARLRLAGRPGERISLLPLAGPARVSFSGVRWPLRAEVLELGRTRGLSNELTAAAASLTLEAGRLLVFHQEFRTSCV